MKQAEHENRKSFAKWAMPNQKNFVDRPLRWWRSHFSRVTTFHKALKVMRGIPILALLVFIALTVTPKAHGQTNGVFTSLATDLGLSLNPTNYAAAPFVGFASHGRTAVGLVVVENVTDNVGLLAGVDTLFGAGKLGSANIVSGGLTLKQSFHPLGFLNVAGWPSNLTATPYAIAMVGTPIRGTGSADGGLASITRAGVDVDFYSWKGFDFGLGVDYGKRTGSAGYNGNWTDVVLKVSKGF